MKKIIERLLIFFIGLPAVIGLVLFLPWFNNLVMNLIIVFLSGVGAVEFSSMLQKKNINITKTESFIFGAIAPLAITLHISLAIPSWIIPVIIMSGVGWALMSGVFSKSSEMENVINKVTGGFSLLVYPGAFMCWIVRMNIWENNYIILLFLFIIFASDSLAWLFGMLFGKNNRGILAASPNKSMAGFTGGVIGPVIIACCAAFFIPNIFPGAQTSAVSSIVGKAAVLGLLSGIAAIFGDLAESAVKRSSGMKDSGNLIPGRGGVLDSIDSVAFAAPVFYIAFSFLFAGF